MDERTARIVEALRNAPAAYVFEDGKATPRPGTAARVALADDLEAERLVVLLTEQVRELLEFAREGWAYAGKYFQGKWDFEGRMKGFEALLGEGGGKA